VNISNLCTDGLDRTGCKSQPTPTSHLEFRVRDYGPGIPEDQREHIGEPFYRSDASRNRDTGGTGLGLYLARQVARAHGGDLVLRDTDWNGALFVVSVPVGS
jgi:signal transduction histidine kinase